MKNDGFGKSQKALQHTEYIVIGSNKSLISGRLSVRKAANYYLSASGGCRTGRDESSVGLFQREILHELFTHFQAK